MTIEETRQLLQPTFADLVRVTNAISDDQHNLPTPTGWTIAELSGHVVGWLENFADGLAAEDHTCPDPDPNATRVGAAEMPARIQAAAAKMDEALRTGAGEHRLIIEGQGGLPAQMAIDLILSEYIIHAWDLAVATGQTTSPDDEAVATAQRLLDRLVEPEHRVVGGTFFGPEVPVPDDASPLVKLLGFAGRDPNWQPPA